MIPFATLGKIERGEMDPGLKRYHILLRLYQLPQGLVVDLLDLEAFSSELPPEKNSTALLEEGRKFWKAGDIRQSLAHLLALRGLASTDAIERLERQRGLLFFAVAASALGKFDLSRQIVDGLLLEPPDEALMVHVLVQQAQCWNSLGSPVASLAFLSQAEAHLKKGDEQGRAWVSHLRANVLLAQHKCDDAEVEIERAVEAYRRAKDNHGESRSFAVRFNVMVAKGDFTGALHVAQKGRAHAEAYNYDRLVIQRRIEEGRALGLLADQAGGISALNSVVAAAITSGDEPMQFYAHYYLWHAYEQAGDAERATFELSTAKFLVRHVDESTPEVNEIRKICDAPIKPSRGSPSHRRRRGRN